MSHATRSQAQPGASRPSKRRGRSAVASIAIIVFLFLAGVGVIGAMAAVGMYTALAANLAPATDLTDYVLPEETVIYDRTGEIELARFGDYQRDIVAFDEIPPIVLDATTAIEDKTFWENAGFDPLGIVAAGIDSIRGNSRGASTITQQLVRARLLDEDLVQDGGRTPERKLKEIIQSIRVTQEFSGESGKEEIITAYLNQNYYGNQTYGVKAAYERYFGKPFTAENVTLSEAALIAALPQSPSNYDLVRNAVEECNVEVEDEEPCPEAERRLVVPEDTKIVQRRNMILELMAEGDRTPVTRDEYSAADFRAAAEEPVVLAPQRDPAWLAPHFVWAVRDELTRQLCGEDTDATCDKLDAGGFSVISTLDLKVQGPAEKWVKLAARVPQRKDPAAVAEELGFDEYPDWVRNLEGKNVHNGALIATDYQTGEVIAYVGSADYYSGAGKDEFQPQFDVLSQGYRQPGSAFKPFNYAVGIDDKTFTAGTMLMDSATDFGGGYTPSNADNLERGPVRVRNALQFSLNIPSVKAMGLNGPDHVFERAKDFGMTFQRETTDAGLALALGVAETRPIDLATAYGTLANEGRRIDPTTILEVNDRNGDPAVDPYVPPEGDAVITPQSAFIVTDILRENTVRAVNPFWGQFQIRDANGDYRPATLKTGTNNDAKDLNAYGYIAPPTQEGRDDGAYALVVGVWNGNSDNTPVSTPNEPVFSIDVSTYVWDGFLSEVSADWPITRFERPDGLEREEIDPFTGYLAGGSGEPEVEYYLPGTQPTDRLPRDTCGVDVIIAVGVEDDKGDWMDANEDWLRRAERGPGTRGGPENTRTSYFYNNGFNPYGRTWGVLVGGGGCGEPSPSPTCFPLPTPDASGVIPSFEIPSPSGSELAALPCPSPSSSASPSPSASATPTATPPPTETPTEAPTEAPTEPPTEAPTEPPTPEPTAEPTPEPTAAPPDDGAEATPAP